MKIKKTFSLFVILFFTAALTVRSQAPESKPDFKPVVPYTSKWRIAASGGLSWRIARLSPDLNGYERKYLKDLKSGKGFDASAAYYFNDLIGVGIKYNLFLSYASVMAYSSTGLSGTLSDDMSIFFIGPKFCSRYASRTKMNTFIMDLAAGYMGYKDIGRFGSDMATLTGKTIGFAYDIGYDVGVSPHLAIGINLCYAIGILTSYDISAHGVTTHTTLDSQHYEGLNHFDIGFGLRLR